MPFSLTECVVKKVLESFYGECTPINYIADLLKNNIPTGLKKLFSAQFQIRSRQEELLSQCLLKPPILFLIIILETLFNLENVMKKWRIATIGGQNEIPMYALYLNCINGQSMAFIKKK